MKSRELTIKKYVYTPHLVGTSVTFKISGIGNVVVEKTKGKKPHTYEFKTIMKSGTVYFKSKAAVLRFFGEKPKKPKRKQFSEVEVHCISP